MKRRFSVVVLLPVAAFFFAVAVFPAAAAEVRPTLANGGAFAAPAGGTRTTIVLRPSPDAAPLRRRRRRPFALLLLAPSASGNLRAVSSARATSSSSSSLLRMSSEGSDEGASRKVVLQRSILSLTKYSDVSHRTSLTLEERVRYRFPTDGTPYLQPYGRRTYLVRGPPPNDDRSDPGGKRKSGADRVYTRVGKELYRIDVHEVTGTRDDSDEGDVSHAGLGGQVWESAAVLALYMMSNPKLMRGEVMELGCGVGLGGLLGCVGAGYAGNLEGAFDGMTSVDDEEEGEGGFATVEEIASSAAAEGSKVEEEEGNVEEEEADVLIRHVEPPPLPPRLKKLTLTDANEQVLKQAFHNLRDSSLPASKVDLQTLNWDVRLPKDSLSAYDTVLGADIAYSFPEVKSLARTIAYGLKPSPYKREINDQEHEGLFVHVGPANRDTIMDLRRKLRDGYKMTADTGYLELQRIDLVPLILDDDAHQTELNSEETLSDVNGGYVEMQEIKKTKYTSLVAEHHEDYGGYDGEMFFPTEIGTEVTTRGMDGNRRGGREEDYLEPDVGFA